MNGSPVDMNANIYNTASSLRFRTEDLAAMPAPRRLLMVQPDYYDIEYVINPHMADHMGAVNKIRAKREWQELLKGFRETDLDVITLDGQPGLPDMVFSANQCLPFCDSQGNKKVIMSLMHSPQRKGEVPFIEQWLRQDGYLISYLDPKKVQSFEGMGDGIWHFRKKLLWGGYGFRTSRDAYREISRLLQVPVVTLELQNERFYHLDTCFCPLNENSVIIYPPAFSSDGIEVIHTLFEYVLEANPHEAENLFAANATCPDGKNVFIQQGSEKMNQKLSDHGFRVHEYSTGEFLKSGGSIYCMKLLIW